MSEQLQVKVPDIGGANDVDVIEVMVSVGDKISVDTPLITLESDKASMEIPSPFEGVVKKIHLKVGDKVSEGQLILDLETKTETKVSDTSVPKQEQVQEVKNETPSSQKQETTQSISREIVIPDIGGATDVDVIEVMVKAGDDIAKDQPLLTLEGDKATMDIPSPVDGKIQSVHVKVGDKVSEGHLILTVQTEQSSAVVSDQKVPERSANPEPVVPETPKTEEPKISQTQQINLQDTKPNQNVLAGPASRRLARELGVDLSALVGSGRSGRIVVEDIQAYVKKKLSEPKSSGMALPDIPEIDFSQFGDIEQKALNKIKKITAKNMQRSWLNIPHVTQFDEADITELEAFRKEEDARAKVDGYRLTLLAFVTRVVSKALKEFPQFASSLHPSGEYLILKQYCHIGIAVDTPDGLVVPVIRDVDKKPIKDIAREMGTLSIKAREKKLTPADMSGGCFTISSLGGIGGTAFTPIVNSPEVAILGLSRSSIKPIYNGEAFIPRLMLPLSLSYDHRVIDGAEAARFCRFLTECLSDIRKILL